MAKKVPILALFGLFCWFLVSLYLHKSNISHSVTRQALQWTQQLSNPKQTTKITQLIKTNPLVTYHTYSESAQPVTLTQILVPVTQYGIPVGYHLFELNLSQLLLDSLIQHRFWIGNIFLLLLLLFSRFIDRIQKSDHLLSAQQFRTKTVVHDLKSPLTLLKALTHLNPDQDNQEDYKKHLQQLEDRFARILTQLQNEDDKMPFIEIQEIKKILADLIQQSQTGYNQSILLDWKIETHRNPQLIYCDSITFMRLIQNVLTNALEANLHNSSHEIRISVYLQNQYLTLEILDQGPGIVQLEIGNSTKGEGRGLGLQYINQTLKNSPHRWKIQNDLSSGQTGCLFTFEFLLLNLSPNPPVPLTSFLSGLELKWLSFWQQTFALIKFWT